METKMARDGAKTSLAFCIARFTPIHEATKSARMLVCSHLAAPSTSYSARIRQRHPLHAMLPKALRLRSLTSTNPTRVHGERGSLPHPYRVSLPPITRRSPSPSLKRTRTMPIASPPSPPFTKLVPLRMCSRWQRR